ncbi:MAG TPA: H-NS histone family protein [Thermoanaerobaculia bacterium]|nr:H-NS histone family protein [Thermoanaerobaculia bacterium]
MAKTGGIDLSTLTIEELQALARDIEEEVVARRESERERVLAQMRELAGSLGMTLEDFLRLERGRGRAANAAAKVPASSTVKYRHPENPVLTWSGRGKRPLWINEWLAAGHTLEELASN